MRTAPTVSSPQFAPVTVNCTWSFTPGNMVVKTLGNIGLETGGVQQVILEQLAGALLYGVGFGEHLQWQICVRPVGQLGQPILQRIGQIDDIPPAPDCGFICRCIRVWVARRRRLFRPCAINLTSPIRPMVWRFSPGK